MLPEEERRLVDVLQQASSLQLCRLNIVLGKMLGDPKRIIEIRRLLHLGQEVRYLDADSGQMRAAQVVQMKDRDVTVRDQATQRLWRVVYAAIEPPATNAHAPGDAAAAPAPQPAKPAREDFQRGQKVCFEDRHLRTQVGVITRINQRTASIDTGDGTWKVSFGLLRHVLDV